MRCRSSYAYLLLGAIVGACCAGCPGSTLKEGPVVLITGKLTNAGQPLELKPDGQIEVIFTPYRDKESKEVVTSEAFPADVNAQGDFKMTGRLGKGIPVGKYRIAVRQWERVQIKPGQKPDPEVFKGRKDSLKQKFSETASTIVRDITTKDTAITIDISKPEG